ncbi:MAG: glycerophosphodiester phosphodiesterase [Acidimicrobiia bacterium]
MLDPDRWNAPVAIAHRGSRHLWPENTMLAFEAAVAFGARHIETDVRVSADGVVHCLHDATVDRTTHASGPISHYTSKELARLDAGFGHATADGYTFRSAGARIPTFEELATSFPDVHVVVDLKEDAVVAPMADLCRRLGIGERLIVGSFSDARLAHFRELTDHQVPTSVGSNAARFWLLASRVRRGLSGPGSALQLPTQRSGVRVIDRRLVDAAHARGLQVHVWTINDPEQMRELLDIGVDGIVTDRIDLLLEVLDSE